MTNAQIKRVVSAIYESRKIRLTNPEGEFIGKRWFPHAREQGDDPMTVSEPTDESRYSYQAHCRTKAHIRHLVHRALVGLEVPADISETVARANVRASVKPTTVIEGISRTELPILMEQFAAFLAAQDVISFKKHVDGGRRS